MFYEILELNLEIWGDGGKEWGEASSPGCLTQQEAPSCASPRSSGVGADGGAVADKATRLSPLVRAPTVTLQWSSLLFLPEQERDCACLRDWQGTDPCLLSLLRSQRPLSECCSSQDKAHWKLSASSQDPVHSPCLHSTRQTGSTSWDDQDRDGNTHSFQFLKESAFFFLYRFLIINLLNAFYLHWSHFIVWLNLYGSKPISFVLHLLNPLYGQTN